MRRRRIVLLRSGRHLDVAIEALMARFEGCRIAVVGTPGSQAVIQQSGIAESDTFICRTPRFQPLSFFFTRTALAVRRWRYDDVAILWNDAVGTGERNVDRTALVMSLRGYLAIAPDGTLIDRALAPQVRTECLRVVASIGVAATIGALLYLPALVFGPFVSAVGRMTRDYEPQRLGDTSATNPENHSPENACHAETILGVSSTEKRSSVPLCLCGSWIYRRPSRSR